jgi:uncharacterized tellurite resistance protein B-like protein
MKDMRLAACALLLELAHADGEFTEDERQHLQSAVRRQFGLGAAEASKLLERADLARTDAAHLGHFTSLIAEHYSTDQKTVFAELMRSLAYADGDLAGGEDYLVRKISCLLRLEPGWV